MKATVGLAAVLALLSWGTTATAHDGWHPKLTIVVLNVSDGGKIQNGDTLTLATEFKVRVRTNGLNCAGQFVVTARGADPSGPPSVLVSASLFIIGPATGSNKFTGEQLGSGIDNTWMISASCNGAGKNHAQFAFFEFSVEPP